MKIIEKNYHSYLLRLWRVKENGFQWRASLEDVQTGALHGFPDLSSLIKYMEEILTENDPAGDPVAETTPE